MRETAGRYDAVVAGIFVRTASFSGRMDLDEDLVAFLRDLAEDAAERGQPFVSVFFGNPYVAPSLPELPSVLLTYDYRGFSERTAVRAIAGEIPIAGRLPVTLGDGLAAGHGLTRRARRPSGGDASARRPAPIRPRGRVYNERFGPRRTRP